MRGQSWSFRGGPVDARYNNTFAISAMLEGGDMRSTWFPSPRRHIEKEAQNYDDASSE